MEVASENILPSKVEGRACGSYEWREGRGLTV